jgi:hypothetical protein
MADRINIFIVPGLKNRVTALEDLWLGKYAVPNNCGTIGVKTLPTVDDSEDMSL